MGPSNECKQRKENANSRKPEEKLGKDVDKNKSTKTKKPKLIETTANFTDDGVEMNMAVTEKENQIFGDTDGAAENSTTSAEETVETETESDERGSEDGELTDKDENNNATRFEGNRGCKSRRMSEPEVTTQGVKSPHPESSNKSDDRQEEFQFMARFAEFMHQQGFIQRPGATVQAVATREEEPQKRSTKQKLDLAKEGGELTVTSDFEVTLYKTAVPISEDGKDLSIALPVNSSDEFQNSSDDSVNLDGLTVNETCC